MSIEFSQIINTNKLEIKTGIKIKTTLINISFLKIETLFKNQEQNSLKYKNRKLAI